MIARIEELSMRAWPAFEERIYDGWVLRFAGGYTKRANSVNPLYPSSIDLAEKIAYCEDEYAMHELPAVFKLTAESLSGGLDEALDAHGYDRLDETSVRVLSLGDECDAAQDIEYHSHVCDAWLEAFARCAGSDDANTVEKLARILRLIPGETFFAYVRGADRIVACGLGVLDRRYLGCFDIAVDKGHRRMGYGRRIMEGLLAEGYRKGALTAYLQVVEGNYPAQRLYDSLGFQEAYRYWYRKK